MKRRESCKGVALVPASGALLSIPGLADAATAGKATEEVTRLLRVSSRTLRRGPAYRHANSPTVLTRSLETMAEVRGNVARNGQCNPMSLY